jgi:hypothetical protein
MDGHMSGQASSVTSLWDVVETSSLNKLRSK